MTIKDKVTEKEKNVKSLLDSLRNHLNQESIHFSKNPNSWNYLTSLGHTEIKLKELVEYFETAPK